ncbi:hypothetical protein EJI01_07950 [Variovorax sp. MHTC-1]|nr:hypothetical protein EJI01_07950 [Variovorax sp. MHTC-1]
MSAASRLRPMLLDERPLPWGDPAWIYELKYDGYRMLAEFGGGQAHLRSRNRADATAWFPEVVASLAEVWMAARTSATGRFAFSMSTAVAISIACRTVRADGAGTRAPTWSRSASSIS